MNAAVSEWCEVARVAPDSRVADAADDVFTTVATRPHAIPAALGRFGHMLGSDGWPIDQVASWVDAMIPLHGRRDRRLLRDYRARLALAHGWAEGFVRGAHSGTCIEPTTGLVTPLVLQLRLREVYAQSAPRSANLDYCMVIIDVDTSGVHALDADLLMVCVADVATRMFTAGETIARSGDRVLVLAPRVDFLDFRVDALIDRLQLNARSRRGLPMVTVDELPELATDINRYVADLTRVMQ